jgi:hypothetical protein
MNAKSSFGNWNFIAFLIITFYTMGAGFVESFVNYPLWHIVGPSEVWTAYHIALGPKIIAVLAIPALLLQLITNVLLLFFRPVILPKWTAWITLILLVVALVSTAVIQLPIQATLDSGYTRELVDYLINTDLYLRIWMTVFRAVIIVYMLLLVVRRGTQPSYAIA